jgi:hypothetical protein
MHARLRSRYFLAIGPLAAVIAACMTTGCESGTTGSADPVADTQTAAEPDLVQDESDVGAEGPDVGQGEPDTAASPIDDTTTTAPDSAPGADVGADASDDAVATDIGGGEPTDIVDAESPTDVLEDAQEADVPPANDEVTVAGDVADDAGVAADDAVDAESADVAAPPACVLETICAADSDCPTSTRCNNSLVPPRCQKLYCGEITSPCGIGAGTQELCGVGLTCCGDGGASVAVCGVGPCADCQTGKPSGLAMDIGMKSASPVALLAAFGDWRCGRRAASDADCAGYLVCSAFGSCHADAGWCVPSGPDSCSGSYGCTTLGTCTYSSAELWPGGPSGQCVK